MLRACELRLYAIGKGNCEMAPAIYLDNSATTRVRDEVADAMRPYLTDKCGNPSSIHKYGRDAQVAIAVARQQVARLLNCQPDEVYFSPCGTYSNNVALLGRARFAEANDHGRHLITTPIEHSSVNGPVKHLESQGWKVTYLPVDRQGFVDPAQLRKSITKETSIISIMWANNEVGTLEPIEELAGIACDAGIYFHTDAVQVAGKLPIDVSRIPVSTLSISGHKFHAPKGIGALFVRKAVNLMPLVFGGGQEHGLFPGTEGLESVAAIGIASELAMAEMEENLASMRRLQEIIRSRLALLKGVKFTGPQDPEKRVPGHVSVLVPGADGEALVMKSDLKGVCISSGSACRQGIVEPSRIVLALGWPQDEALGSARISAGLYNTEDECRQAVDLLADVFSALHDSAAACGKVIA